MRYTLCGRPILQATVCRRIEVYISGPREGGITPFVNAGDSIHEMLYSLALKYPFVSPNI